MLEEWRDVVGYEGYYKVSSFGNVKSVNRSVLTNGKTCILTGKPKAQTKTKKGYLQVTLSKNGVSKNKLVHHLVLEAFVGPKLCNLQACHFPDNTKTNNTVTNLYWGTSKENTADKMIQGTMAVGNKINTCKLTEKQVIEIRNIYFLISSPRKIARLYNVGHSNIRSIINRKTWKHI